MEKFKKLAKILFMPATQKPTFLLPDKT